jgi:hypothetical protein
MKTLIICFILLFILNSYSFSQTSFQNRKRNYNLLNFKLTVFENSKDGKKYKIYSFDKKKFQVYDKPLAKQSFKEHLYTKHKFNSDKLFREISNLNLGELKEAYFNNCVDTITGYDYFILLETKAMTKSITLHHYYIRQVDDLVGLLNNYLPQTLQIKYLARETRQDCTKQN